MQNGRSWAHTKARSFAIKQKMCIYFFLVHYFFGIFFNDSNWVHIYGIILQSQSQLRQYEVDVDFLFLYK